LPDPDTANYLIIISTLGYEFQVVQLDDAEKIFVHNLYYGVHKACGYSNSRKWVFQEYNIAEKRLSEEIILPDLFSTDIGSSICFEIFDGYFYAVSTEPETKEKDTLDGSTFYYGIRLLADWPTTTERTGFSRQLWRRQNREGPLDDRWARLNLSLDEVTGEINIIETRVEYAAGTTEWRLACYTTRLIFPERSVEDTVNLSSTGLPSLVLSSDLAVPRHPRLPSNVYYSSDGFSTSCTPLQYYNSSVSAFVDLIADRSIHSFESTNRLRLRVKLREPCLPAKGKRSILVPEGPAETYTTPPMAFWPPEQILPGTSDEALEDLYGLLSPPSHIGDVEGVADERSLVYMTGSGNLPKAIVLVNFDPSIKLGGLRKWGRERGNGTPMKLGGGVKQEVCEGEGDKPIVQERDNSNSKENKQAKECGDVVWIEPAMYVTIGKGFNLSRGPYSL
jgi:hypothetical protein